MGAVLAAIVHAPLASILILLETTRNSGLMLPAMLATVTATAMARIVLSDSIYTLSLRRRGLNVSAGAEGSCSCRAGRGARRSLRLCALPWALDRRQVLSSA